MAQVAYSRKTTVTRQVAKYLPRSDFGRQLRQGVDEYFERSGQQRRDVPRAYVKAAVIMAWYVGSYLFVLLVASAPWQGVLGGVSLGLAAAGIGFNLQHDGSHGAFSSRRWVNRVMALGMDLIGASSYFWHYKHNIAHHSHPNILGQDDDINHGMVLRVSPFQKWYPQHRFQVAYSWFLYSLLAIEWQTAGELRNYASRRWVGSTYVPPPRGWDRAVFWITRALFFGLAFVLPLSLHSVGSFLAVYLVYGLTFGLTMAMVFQVAHCSDMTAFRDITAEERLVPRTWAEHQVETTVNFARKSRLLSWYLGGLNFQIEHHLFPRICHVHYPRIAPIVEAVCAEHGVRYTAHASLLAAMSSHWRWLRRMGRPPVTGPSRLPPSNRRDTPSN